MSELPSQHNTEQELQAEIERLNKIIKALIERAEHDMNSPCSEFDAFQNTIMLEDKVRIRTQELENALYKNEKITRSLQQANKVIEESKERLHDITSALGEGLLVIDKKGVLKFINTAACKLLGFTIEEALGKNAHQLFHHSYLDGAPFPAEQCNELNVLHTRQPYFSEDEHYWRKDGTSLPVSVISTPIRLNENTHGVVVAFHDMTQSMDERIRLREMQSAIEHSPASVLIFDKDRNIIYSNPALMRATGYTKEELKNQKTYIFKGHQTPEGNYENLWQTILSGSPWSGEILYSRKDESTFWQSWKIAPIIDQYGVIHNFVGVGEDITEKRKLQALLQEKSYQDGLTGIANRRRFDEYYYQEWYRGLRNSKPLSLILGDIDFFKRYNDSLGHLAGDECLKQIARALKNNVHRATDLVARYGGEEFVCFLPETYIEGAKIIAEKLRQAVYELKLLNPGSELFPYVTISIGVACCIPQKGISSNSLIGAADAALYQAKKRGRNRVEVCSSSGMRIKPR